MGWASLILGFLSDLFSKVFMKAMGTPAIKEEINVEEGDAPALSVREYDGLYFMCDRDKGEARDPDDKPCPDTGSGKGNPDNSDGRKD